MELIDGTYITLDDYLSSCEEKHKNTVYYATDKSVQAQYISMFESEGVKVVLLPHQLDGQYISMCESVNSDVKFKRIDSDITDMLKSENNDSIDGKPLIDFFKGVLNNDKLEVKIESLKDKQIPAVLTVSEESRRMQDMMKMYSSMGMNIGESLPLEYSLVLNSSSTLIEKISSALNEDGEKAKLIAKEVYMLALISQRQMTADELKDFLAQTTKILEIV